MYKATLFHPEGDKVTDFYSNSKDEVREQLADMGSRWIFYPLAFITTEKTIIESPEGLEFLNGKRIKTARKYLQETWKDNADEICEVINEGYPLSLVYNSSTGKLKRPAQLEIMPGAKQTNVKNKIINV